MGRVRSFGLTGRDTKGIGKTESKMGKEYFIGMMETGLREITRMGDEKEKPFSIIQMVG